MLKNIWIRMITIQIWLCKAAVQIETKLLLGFYISFKNQGFYRFKEVWSNSKTNCNT